MLPSRWHTSFCFCCLSLVEASAHRRQRLIYKHLCAELIEANIDKTLALTISFGRISRDQFWGAIEERLGPLMLEVRHRVCRPYVTLLEVSAL